MSKVIKQYLGATLSTAIGGDAWYLVGSGFGGLALQGRFEDDRGALGTPLWVHTKFCTEQGECLLPLTMPLPDKPPEEYSFVPEQIWAAARAEMLRLGGGQPADEPGAAPDPTGR